jgi:hypothetical protein
LREKLEELRGATSSADIASCTQRELDTLMIMESGGRKTADTNMEK